MQKFGTYYKYRKNSKYKRNRSTTNIKKLN